MESASFFYYNQEALFCETKLGVSGHFPVASVHVRYLMFASTNGNVLAAKRKGDRSSHVAKRYMRTANPTIKDMRRTNVRGQPFKISGLALQSLPSGKIDR